MANNAARASSSHKQQARSASPTAGHETGASLSSSSKQSPSNSRPANTSVGHLLSPDSALDPSRRKSTLSANGFFIDHSCTRRRSSAAAHAREQQLLLANNQAPAFLHPARWQARQSVGHATSADHRPSSVGLLSARNRHSSCAGQASPGAVESHRASLFVPAIGSAPTALVGSRKTSIFDPTGHSLGLARSGLASRRRSTMVTGAVGLPVGAATCAKTAPGLVVEPSTSRMMNVAAAAAKSGQPSRLSKHVPVLGCSPTSIRASLAALEETRRYEKLLRRLQNQQRQRAKKKQRELARARDHRSSGTSDKIHGDNRRAAEQHEMSLAGNLRRKSILALRDAALLIRRRTSTSDRIRSRSVCSSAPLSSRWTRHTSGTAPTDTGDKPDASDADADARDYDYDYDEPTEDDMDRLSMSSLSFITSSSRSSVPSLLGRKLSPEVDGQNNRLAQTAGASPDKSISSRSSLVRKAMRRLTGRPAGAGSIGSARAARSQPGSPSSPLGRGRRSELGFWYHYYYYLRENSVMDDCLDLPISSSSLGQLGAASKGATGAARNARLGVGAGEHRARLHINYSLNRLEIVNSRWDPSARSLAVGAGRLACDAGYQLDPKEVGVELGALDYDQSTDVSLSLSTSSQTSTEESLEETTNETFQCAPGAGEQNNGAAGGDRRAATSRPGSTNKSADCQAWHGSVHLQAPESPAPPRNNASHESSLTRRSNSSKPNSFCSRDSYAGSLSSATSNTCRAGKCPAGYLAGQGACVQPVSGPPEFLYSTCPPASSHNLEAQQQQTMSRLVTPDAAASLHNMDMGLDRVQSRTGDRCAHSEHDSRYLVTSTTSQDCSSSALSQPTRRSLMAPGYSHNNLITPEPDELVGLGSMGRRSASFSTELHEISRPDRQPRPFGCDLQAGQDNEEELDDFERFNRSHRGYKPQVSAPLASSQQKQSISPAKMASVSQVKREGKTIKPHTSLRSSFKSALKFCRAGQASARRTPGSLENVPGLRSGTRISMSWDMLARPDEQEAGSELARSHALGASRLSFRDPGRDTTKRFELVHGRAASSVSNYTLANNLNDGQQARAWLMIEPSQLDRFSQRWQGAFGEATLSVQAARSDNCVAELGGAGQSYQQPQYWTDQRHEFGLPLRSEPICTSTAGNQSRAARRCTSASFHESSGRRRYAHLDEPNRLYGRAGSPSTAIGTGLSLSNELRPVEVRLKATESQPYPDAQVVDNCEPRERAHSAGTGSVVYSQLAAVAGLGANSYQVLPSEPAGPARAQAPVSAASNQARAGASSSSPRPPGSEANSPDATIRVSVPARDEPTSGSGLLTKMVGTCEARAIELLRKNCFTCTLIGDRQSGKRTIVKCFIKLLNEFKLAAQEYRREKMLAKLMDCSERLQTLAVSGANASCELDDSAQSSPVKVSPRARMNSWFAEGKKLLNLSTGTNKRRPKADQFDGLAGQQQHQRRHTTALNRSEHFPASPLEPTNSRASSRGPTLKVSDIRPQLLETSDIRSPQGSDSDNSGSCDSSSICSSTSSPPSSSELSSPASKRAAKIGSRLDDCNRSDFNISYHADHAGPSGSSRALDGQMINNSRLKVTALPLGPRRSLNERYIARSRPISPTDNQRTNSSLSNRASRYGSAARLDRFHLEDAAKKPARIPRIGLKQLNKRRYRVRFSTRRKLNSKYLEDTEDNSPAVLPDCFIVVYAVNDRESFEFARYVISQLRALRLDAPLPIILVANKIDLERAKVVKSEEGRALARKSLCKFIEVSCTVGFNLDNLLVGMRTQLVLKHHAEFKNCRSPGKAATNDKNALKSSGLKEGRGGGFLMRFYKRCIADNQGNYDCDNFSRL